MKRSARGILGVLFVLSAVVGVAPATAQQNGRAPRQQGERAGQVSTERRLERRMALLTERLSLSAQQAARVRPILQREQEQLQAVFGRAGNQRGQWARGERRAWPDSARARAGRGDGGRERGDSARGERREGYARADRRAGGTDAQRAQLRARVEQIRAETERQLARVLTAEQLERYRALRPEGGRGAWGYRRGAAAEGAERGGRSEGQGRN